MTTIYLKDSLLLHTIDMMVINREIKLEHIMWGKNYKVHAFNYDLKTAYWDQKHIKNTETAHNIH